MRRRTGGRGLVLGVSLLALVGFGCTPDTVTPTPSPSPSSPATATPTETAQEREERLAYEAAEKSYREFRSEFNRVLSAGGSRSATARMTATAGHTYLKDNLEVVQAYKGLGYRQEGTDKVVFVHKGGYSPTSLVLKTCEDSTGANTLSKTGKLIGRGDVRMLDLEVRKVDGRWKVWSGTGNKVKACEE